MCGCVCASTCPFAHVRSRCRHSTESMSHLEVDLKFLEVFTQLEHLSVTFRDGSLQRLLILRHHCCRVLRANRWIFTPLSLSRSRACMYACVHIFACTRLQVCDVYLNAILIHIVKLFLLLPDQRPQRTASIQLRPRHRAHRRTWTYTGCKCPLRRVLHSKHLSIKQTCALAL